MSLAIVPSEALAEHGSTARDMKADREAHDGAGGNQVPHLQPRVGERQAGRTDYRCQLVAACRRTQTNCHNWQHGANT